jgi:hypothetical protein
MPCGNFPQTPVHRFSRPISTARQARRFFPVAKGSAVEAFNDLAPRYPVFELQPLDETAHGAGKASP